MSFTLDYLQVLYGENTELAYLATRMSPTFERCEWWRDAPYGWHWADCKLPDWCDVANDYSPEPPDEAA